MSLDSSNFKVVISQVRVSNNSVLSFVLKEICPDKIPENNTYIVKIQGIEMNNLTNVEKVKIEEGVWQFSVNLCPILPALEQSPACVDTGNVLEVEGTSSMMIAGYCHFDGFYTLSCNDKSMSIYSKNGINFLDCNILGVTGYYCKVVYSSSNVRYVKKHNDYTHIIFYYPPQEKWYVKQIVCEGKKVNKILYEQKCKGSPYEVPLKGWKVYISSSPCPGHCIPDIKKDIILQPCVPFDDNISNTLLVNCSGVDSANGCYYKDVVSNCFINVKDPNFIIKYKVDKKKCYACWVLVDMSEHQIGQTHIELYKSPNLRPDNFNLCVSCIPCYGWTKLCEIPGDPPQVTSLDYYSLDNPIYNMSYASSGNCGWTLFDGLTVVGRGMSDHYIIVGTTSTTPILDGAYCLSTVHPTPPVYTKVLNADIVMEYNEGEMRWEIKDGATVMYSNTGCDSNVPPYNGWVKEGIVDGNPPLVLNTVLPSSINWVSV